MYCSFFGFREKPFDVTPDHRFLYETPGHREALASIVYGIRERMSALSGYCEVDSRPGQGSVFIVTIPAAPPDDTDTQ